MAADVASVAGNGGSAAAVSVGGAAVGDSGGNGDVSVGGVSGVAVGDSGGNGDVSVGGVSGIAVGDSGGNVAAGKAQLASSVSSKKSKSCYGVCQRLVAC